MAEQDGGDGECGVVANWIGLREFGIKFDNEK